MCGRVGSRRFPFRRDEHLLAVLRYVERNPVRARSLGVRKAERWPWSSIGRLPARRRERRAWTPDRFLAAPTGWSG